MPSAWNSPEARAKAAATREANKLKKLATEQRETARKEGGVFSGVGDSRPFVAPEGSIDREINILECHLNGKRIGDLNFTPEQVALLAFKNTDEGIATFQLDQPVSAFERELRTYKPTRGDELDGVSWETPDKLLKNTAAPYERPGFAQRYLGERRSNEAGLRGWQPVKDKNGDLVKVGKNLFLGEMPEQLAAKRRARNKAESDAAQREIGEQMQVNQERFIRDGGLPLKPNEILRRGGEAVAQEGVHIRRGNTVE